ncbi:MAG: MFS transporter [Deferrisomatales bacterium]
MAPDPAAAARRYRWVIFWTLAGGYVLVYFHRLCPAVVAVDMMADLAAGGTLLGILSAAYFYPYALMQLPAGLLSDSWGPRRTVTASFFVATAGSLLLAMAPTVSAAIAGRVLVGLGVSMLFVPTMKILAEWFVPAEFATMTGILLAMGGLGSLAAAAPLAWLSGRIGWRLFFAAVGGLTLLLAGLVWRFVRDSPARMGWPAPGPRPAYPLDPLSLGEGVRRVLTHPPFWPLAAWFFFECAVFFSFGGLWGGPYMIHVHGLSKGETGRILSMLAVGMAVGSPLLGALSNRVFRARKPVIVLASAVTVGLTAWLALAPRAISVPGLYALCLALGAFTSAVVVVGFTAAKELFPVQIAGTATGLVNLFPFAGGAVFQPVLGAVLEHYRVAGGFSAEGYAAAFRVLWACAVVALAASLALRETFPGR